MVTAEQVQAALQEHLQASDVVVIDNSGGCGTAFEVAVVTSQFEGKRLLERHRMVRIKHAHVPPSTRVCTGQRSAQGTDARYPRPVCKACVDAGTAAGTHIIVTPCSL